MLEFSSGATIIIADNCSSDGSSEMIRNEFPSIEIIQIQENLGFCGGYNYALQQVSSRYYVLLNSDIEVTRDWLSPLISILDADVSVAAVQPRVLSYDHRNKFEYAGAGGGFIDSLGYPFCRGRIFETFETDDGQYSDARPIFWATGACLAIRSEDFHKMGGFDADFFAHMEEIDLCWKLNRAGRQIYYAGQSVVYHVGGGTLSRLDARKTYLNFRNGLFLMLKNMKANALWWKLPLRMGLDWVALLSFLVNGSFKNAIAVLKAHLHFLLGFGKALKKRKQFSGAGFSVREGLIYPGSIIVAYFVKGQKNYKQLGF